MGSTHPEAASGPQPADLARCIDHTLLRPEASAASLDRLCQEAVRYGFFGVCINSSRVAHVARKLQGTGVRVCSVVGFPLGSATRRAKAFEAREAVSDGASEIHMVLNAGLLRSGDYRAVEEDIRAVRRATRASTVLNVIIEMVLLSQEEKVLACELSRKAGADFVTTSTGFLGGSATAEDIALARRVGGKDLQVKANGGVRRYRTAVAMIAAGASRIGSQSSVAIMKEAEAAGSI
ncbi:MAG TPA: deoxyribose-phosphate aldolase [Spirochaetia bacterium]|nr:deoxyribose-phosphate aldolase [Spirochaetia bacterium]